MKLKEGIFIYGLHIHTICYKAYVRLAALGSWLVARGSRLVARGSWLEAQNIGSSCGSWLMARVK